MFFSDRISRRFGVVLLSLALTSLYTHASADQQKSETPTEKLKHLFESTDPLDKDEVLALIDAGADLNAAAPDNVNALAIASYLGLTDLVESELGAKADLNIAYNKCFTPLMIASYNGHTEIVKLLKKHGAKK